MPEANLKVISSNGRRRHDRCKALIDIGNRNRRRRSGGPSGNHNPSNKISATKQRVYPKPASLPPMRRSTIASERLNLCDPKNKQPRPAPDGALVCVIPHPRVAPLSACKPLCAKRTRQLPPPQSLRGDLNPRLNPTAPRLNPTAPRLNRTAPNPNRKNAPAESASTAGSSASSTPFSGSKRFRAIRTQQLRANPQFRLRTNPPLNRKHLSLNPPFPPANPTPGRNAPAECPRPPQNPHTVGQGVRFQMSEAYSAIVRSLENFPDPAIFKIALRENSSRSAYNRPTRS